MFEASLRYNNPNNNPVVETLQNKYDSLVIEGHLIAHSTKALPRRLKRLSDDSSTNYYIDPVLSDFHHEDNFKKEGNIRGWHKKYLEWMEDPLKSLLQDGTEISPHSIDEKDVDTLARDEIQFQESVVPERLEKHANKYEEFEFSKYTPRAVIPWYYQIESPDDLEINSSIIDASLQEASLPVKPCIHVSLPFLHRESTIESLVELVDSEEITECFLWVDDLDKQNTSQPDYVRVLKLVDELSDKGVNPHFLYGDYFATVCSYFGASGTTYGTMYGEESKEKQERSSSGGGMLSRYYTSPIKDFLKIPATVQVMRTAEADMCDCDVCERQLESWDDLTELEKKDSDEFNMQAFLGKHHILVRWEQIQELQEKSLDEILNQLEDDYQKYITPYSRSNQVSPDKKLDYMQRWLNAAKQYR